jgi:hypothetical protein
LTNYCVDQLGLIRRRDTRLNRSARILPNLVEGSWALEALSLDNDLVLDPRFFLRSASRTYTPAAPTPRSTRTTATLRLRLR